MNYFVENWIGFAIAGAIAALIPSVVAWMRVRWKRRWGVDRFAGVPVRFARGATFTHSLGKELTEGLEVIKEVIREGFPENPELLDFMVEVVPPGEIRTPSVPAGVLPDGSRVGGSFRTERWMWPFRRHWVAVVVNERTVQFVAHEVCSHMSAHRLSGDPNTHDLSGRYFSWATRWKDLTQAAQEAIGRLV